MFHKYGIGLEGGFVFGLDGDKPDVFENTLNFAREVNLESMIGFFYTPIPGTEVYQKLKSEGRLLTEDYSKYDFRHVVVKPKNMSADELHQGVSWMTKEFYSGKDAAKRVISSFTDLLAHPSKKRLYRAVATTAINAAFRNRIRNLSVDGTFS